MTEKLEDIMMDYRVTRIKRGSYFEMDKSHVHDFYEIYYLISGTRRYFINDSIYTINKGDIVVIPEGTIHRTTYNNEKVHERMDCKFDRNYIDDIPEAKSAFMSLFVGSPVLSLHSAHREYVERILNNIRSEYENPDEFSADNARALIHQLIICLTRLKKMQGTNVQNDLDDSLIQEAARYIRANYSSPLTLEAVAKHINISPTYFSKKFKAATGFGYREYLVNVRLQEAARLLLETKLSITEIALKCGFNDSNYFGDVFRRAKGISPMSYRKNNKFY